MGNDLPRIVRLTEKLSALGTTPVFEDIPEEQRVVTLISGGPSVNTHAR